MRSICHTLWVLVLVLGMALPALADGGGSGTVVVINESDFVLDIHVDGTKRFTLQTGTRRTVGDLSPGVHQFKALTQEGLIKFRKDMRVEAGQKLSWYLKWARSEGKLVIENANGTPLIVFVDDAETLGVPATDESVYRNLASGPHTVRLAYFHGEERIDLLTTEIEVGGESKPVVVAPVMDSGSIAVQNDTAARLRVVIDGEQAGWLEPGEDGRYEPYTVGVHRIRVVDERGQLVRHQAVQVDVFETVVLLVPGRRSSARPRSWAGRERSSRRAITPAASNAG